ncbi:MAG: hypothetical protein CR982_09650 [Candidatus Cloacimonadota bacterium]|nr:MAG: hypothetical protein CR982_09650 [Candidatus Cloacimonadota bacterium]PIE78174.1 MAG: hypothetical protein CSA15_08965 [Candidatus Delongbacteria bacterium]
MKEIINGLNGKSSSVKKVSYRDSDEYQFAGYYITCPYCEEEYYTEEEGEIYCKECGEQFTIDEETKEPIGLIIEYPHCHEEYYTEEIGRIECRECGDEFTLRKR